MFVAIRSNSNFYPSVSILCIHRNIDIPRILMLVHALGSTIKEAEANRIFVSVVKYYNKYRRSYILYIFAFFKSLVNA